MGGGRKVTLFSVIQLYLLTENALLVWTISLPFGWVVHQDFHTYKPLPPHLLLMIQRHLHASVHFVP